MLYKPSAIELYTARHFIALFCSRAFSSSFYWTWCLLCFLQFLFSSFQNNFFVFLLVVSRVPHWRWSISCLVNNLCWVFAKHLNNGYFCTAWSEWVSDIVDTSECQKLQQNTQRICSSSHRILELAPPRMSCITAHHPACQELDETASAGRSRSHMASRVPVTFLTCTDVWNTHSTVPQVLLYGFQMAILNLTIGIISSTIAWDSLVTAVSETERSDDETWGCFKQSQYIAPCS